MLTCFRRLLVRSNGYSVDVFSETDCKVKKAPKHVLFYIITVSQTYSFDLINCLTTGEFAQWTCLEILQSVKKKKKEEKG